jgi:hypothetical protein
MACSESEDVNGGRPYPLSQGREYQPTSVKARELRWRNERKIGSQIRHSTPSLGKLSTWGRPVGNFASEEET